MEQLYQIKRNTNPKYIIMNKNLKIWALMAAIACLGLACTQTEPEEEEVVSQKITASLVDNNSASKWAKNDAIGVYTDASENNVKYTTASAGTSVAFTAATEVKGAPKYAYYPYDAMNASNKATGLVGTLAQDQTANVVDYRYGTQTGTDKNGDATFQFQSVFATVRFNVDLSASTLKGQQVTSLECKVTRNGAAVPLCGGFSFSAADGSYSYGSYATYNEFVAKEKAVIFPTVVPGDVLEVKVNTAKSSATVTLPVDGYVEAGGYYPVSVVVTDADVADPEEYEGEAPSITALSFTAAQNPGKILAKKLFYDLNKTAGTKKGGFLNLQTTTYKGATNYTTATSETTQTMKVSDETCTISGCIPYLNDRNLVPTVTLSNEDARLQYSTDGNNFCDWDGQSAINFSKGNVIRAIQGKSYRDYVVEITNTGLPVMVVNQPGGDKDWSNIGEKMWSKETDFDVIESGNPGTVTIYNADGTVSTSETTAMTRLRGNTTQDYPKKPFAVKFASKTSVLGMPKHKRWVLLANWKDKSLMRNHIALGIGRKFSEEMPDGLPWNVRGQFVELVYNGVHVGNYYLCEQIKIDGNRVDIQDEYEKSNGSITAAGMENYGYLMEVDDNFDEAGKFMTKHHLPFMFKDDVDDGGVIVKTIKAKVQGIEDNLYKGYKGTASAFTTAYKDLDLASVVDQLLIYEMSMNTEFRHPKSVYMYMDGLGKLKAGPVWDFDWLSFPTLGSGYTEESDRSYTASLMAMSSMISAGRQVSSSAPSSKDDDDRKDAPFMWYPMLIKDPTFTKMAADRWKEMSGVLAAYASEINATRDLIAVSWEYNNAMWPAYYGDGKYDRQYHITNGMCGDEKLKTFDEVCQALYAAYMARLNGMNSFVSGQNWPTSKWKF